MTQTERIIMMEEYLDSTDKALNDLEKALDAYMSAREKIKALDAYYGSQEWFDDLRDDEEGRLPADLKRGVLSEDGIYDVLIKDKELPVRMLECAAEILKNQ